MNYPRINIIFRCCDAVNAVNKSPRPFDLDKKTLIKICFKSLLNSLQGFNYKLIVLGDNLSVEMKTFFQKHDLQLIEGVFGNDNSIRKSIEIALEQSANEWVYFCEDDYLHTQDFFLKIVTLIKEKQNIIPASIKIKKLLRKRQITLFSFPRFFAKPNLVIFPCDYPDRYLIDYSEKNFIFKTSNSHWRQVSDTTFTFLIETTEVKKHQRVLFKSANKANDRYLSKKLYGKSFFFNKLLCLSPIPTLSTHMHITTMSPLINFEVLVNQLINEV
ncbi:MAG: hypothetical protein NWQ17_06070 [Polaribacter sp.]|nr:hypothetical protein [Polaribacter sp.]